MVVQFTLTRRGPVVTVTCVTCPATALGSDADTRLVAWKSAHACRPTRDGAPTDERTHP